MEAAVPALTVAILGLAVIVAVSLISNQGEFDTQEDTTVNDTAGNKVQAMAAAIARAEGFGVPLAIPTQANNPGDLKIPGWPKDKQVGEGISVFPSVTEGWSRLYRQLNLIVNGQSKVYTLGDTINSMAVKWTGSDNALAWANIVASTLGTETDALLSEVLL